MVQHSCAKPTALETISHSESRPKPTGKEDNPCRAQIQTSELYSRQSESARKRIAVHTLTQYAD